MRDYNVYKIYQELAVKNKAPALNKYKLYQKYNDGKYIYTHKPHGNFITLEEFDINYIWSIMDQCTDNYISIHTYFKCLTEFANLKYNQGRKLNCFRRSQKCAGCGIIGNIFLLQNNGIHSSSTLELYNKAEEGITHMTVDHIIPRSFAGTYSMENITTMCYPCNQKKGNKYPYFAG